jgi:hypothetical protein
LWGDLEPGELHRLAGAFPGLALTALPGDVAVARPDAIPAFAARCTALLHRYRDGLIAVGVRAPALEGAALLGIPTFMIDDTPLLHLVPRPRDGHYLVDTRGEHGVDARMMSLTRALNSFIRVDARALPRDVDGQPRLDAQTLADLMTAVRVWTGRELAGGHPYWRERVRLCRSGLARLTLGAVRTHCCEDARLIRP